MFRVHLYRIMMVVYDVLYYLPYGLVHEVNDFDHSASRLSSDVMCKQDTTLRTSTPTNVWPWLEGSQIVPRRVKISPCDFLTLRDGLEELSLIKKTPTLKNWLTADDRASDWTRFSATCVRILASELIPTKRQLTHPPPSPSRFRKWMSFNINFQ
jgi:hypothetical protein